MSKKAISTEPIIINVERDLKKHMRAINQLLNNNPELARLVVVNPILVLEDLGVTISSSVKQHIMDALRFPPKLVAQRDQMASELHTEFEKLGVNYKLPLSNETRAHLVFKHMQIKPLKKDKKNPNHLTSDQLKNYKDKSPLLAKLEKYERWRQGGMIFHPRAEYQKYKSGEKNMKWIKAITFKV